jgi:hypothetical protein
MHTNNAAQNTGKRVQPSSQSNRPNIAKAEPVKNADRGRKILELLNLPNLEEPTNPNATDIQILDRLTEQLKPTIEYLDLLVQNINHYINTKKARKNPVEELLKGTVQLERFFKKKLLDASKEITNPLITNLLQLTAHDVTANPRKMN